MFRSFLFAVICNLFVLPQDLSLQQHNEDEDYAVSGNASASARRAEITRGENVHLELLHEFHNGLLFVGMDQSIEETRGVQKFDTYEGVSFCSIQEQKYL